MIQIKFDCGCTCAVYNLSFVRITPVCILHSVNTPEGKQARTELEKKAKEQAAQYETLNS